MVLSKDTYTLEVRGIVNGAKRQNPSCFLLSRFLSLDKPLVRNMTELLEKEKTYTVAEYFEIDTDSEVKLEYHNGKIIPTSGEITTHSKIVVKIITVLSNLLDDQPFEVYNSEVKVQIPEYKKFVYPDVMVVRGQPVYFENRKDIITNPLLVVEVLSPSTQRHDKTNKFLMYRTLPSLKEYVLVEQDQARVTTLFRNDAQHWEDTDVVGLDQSVRLRSIESEITLARIYKNITFD